MTIFESLRKEARAIVSAINTIKVHEYDQLGYDIEKWQLALELSANNLDYINYSRVYVFNTLLSPTINKQVLIQLKVYTIEQFTDAETAPNITGFLLLKYPFSEIPQ